MGGVCQDAAGELFARLNSTDSSEAFGFDADDPAPSWMWETNGEVEYRLWFSEVFLGSPSFSGIQHQIIVHELTGHYLEGYSDGFMSAIDFGSECNPANQVP